MPAFHRRCHTETPFQPGCDPDPQRFSLDSAVTRCQGLCNEHPLMHATEISAYRSSGVGAESAPDHRLFEGKRAWITRCSSTSTVVGSHR